MRGPFASLARVACLAACIVVFFTGCGAPAAPSPPAPVTVPPPKVLPKPEVLPLAWRWASPFPRGNPLRDVWGAGELLVAVGARGTLLVSRDAGVTWVAKETEQLGTEVDLVAVHGDARGETIWVSGASGTLLRSRDRGETWSATATHVDDALGALWTDATGKTIVVAGDRGALLRSADGGATWTDIGGNLHASWLHVVGDESGTLVAVSATGRVITSTDGGATSRIGDLATQPEAVWIDHGAILVLAHGGQLRTSTDRGATWTTRESALPYANRARGVWGDDAGLVAVGEAGKLVRSLDRGATWEPLDAHTEGAGLEGVWGVAGVLVATGDDGAIRRSVDGGSTWALVNGVTEARLDAAWFADDGSAWAGGVMEKTGKGALLRSLDHGASWSLAEGAHGFVRSIWAANEDDVFVVEQNRLLRSRDRGRTWRPAPEDRAPTATGAIDTVWGDGHGSILAHGAPGVRSTDGGVTWDTLALAPTLGAVHAFAADESGAIWAVGANGFVARSSDHGASWREVPAMKTRQDLVGVAVAGGVVVIAERHDIVWRSTDGGATFVASKHSRRGVFVGARAVTHEGARELHLFVDEGEILVSADGASWTTEALPAKARVHAFAENGLGERLAVGAHGAVLVRGTRRPLPPTLEIAAAPATTRGSPFAPAIETARARRELDAKHAAELATTFEPILRRALGRLVRPQGSPGKGTRAAWNDAALDMSLESLKKSYRVGAFQCDATLGRSCPSRRFFASLDPKTHADDVGLVRGDFVDAVLFHLSVATLPFPSWKDEEHKRAYPDAFELAVTRILGAPKRVSDRTHPLDVRLSYDDDRVAVVMKADYGLVVTIELDGAAAGAVAEALAKRIASEEEAESARRQAARKQELCTCKHLAIGQEWPPPSSGGMPPGNTMTPHTIITAVDPKTCSASLTTKASPIEGPRTETRACSDLDSILFPKR